MQSRTVRAQPRDRSTQQIFTGHWATILALALVRWRDAWGVVGGDHFGHEHLHQMTALSG